MGSLVVEGEVDVLQKYSYGGVCIVPDDRFDFSEVDINFGVRGIADDARIMQQEHVGSRLFYAGFEWTTIRDLFFEIPSVDFEVFLFLYIYVSTLISLSIKHSCFIGFQLI